MRDDFKRDLRSASTVFRVAQDAIGITVLGRNSVQEMVGQDYCTERGEAEEDEAEDGVDEAEKGRADPMGDKTNNDDQHGEPSHQTGGGH